MAKKKKDIPTEATPAEDAYVEPVEEVHTVAPVSVPGAKDMAAMAVADARACGCTTSADFMKYLASYRQAHRYFINTWRAD